MLSPASSVFPIINAVNMNMAQQPDSTTRTIKYSYNTATGQTIRVNTQRKAGEGRGSSADVYEVRDIPNNVTDQQVQRVYESVDTYWYVRIKIYSYSYDFLKSANWIPLPTVREHLDAIKAYKQKEITEVIEYLATIMDKGVSTMWRIYKEDKAPRETLLALNSVAYDILEGRLWTKD